MTYLFHSLKKTSQKIMFNLYGLQCVWKHSLFWLFGTTTNLKSLYCSRMWPLSCKLISTAYSSQLQFHTENQWLQLEMSIHLAHSFIFSPAWKQHQKCLNGTLINSEGFISKQLFPQAPFHFKKYLNYKTIDERGHFRSPLDELCWLSTEEVHLKW